MQEAGVQEAARVSCCLGLASAPQRLANPLRTLHASQRKEACRLRLILRMVERLRTKEDE